MYMKLVTGIDVSRFLAFCVEITKCLPDANQNKNHNQTEMHEVLKLKYSRCFVMPIQSGLNLILQLVRTHLMCIQSAFCA